MASLSINIIELVSRSRHAGLAAGLGLIYLKEQQDNNLTHRPNWERRFE